LGGGGRPPFFRGGPPGASGEAVGGGEILWGAIEKKRGPRGGLSLKQKGLPAGGSPAGGIILLAFFFSSFFSPPPLVTRGWVGWRKKKIFFHTRFPKGRKKGALGPGPGKKKKTRGFPFGPQRETFGFQFGGGGRGKKWGPHASKSLCPGRFLLKNPHHPCK